MSPLKDSNPDIDIYPYSLFYVYYDQYGYIRSVAIENMLLAIAVVFIAVTIIQEIRIALIICAMVLLTTIDLIGFVYLTSTIFPDSGFIVEVNAISVLLLLLRSSTSSLALDCLWSSLPTSAFPCSSSKAHRNRSSNRPWRTQAVQSLLELDSPSSWEYLCLRWLSPHSSDSIISGCTSGSFCSVSLTV